MTKTNLIATGLCLGYLLFSANLQAQDAAEFAGTWYNAEFMNELKKTSSVSKACAELKHGAPVFLQISIDDSLGVVSVGVSPVATTQMTMKRVLLNQMGYKWVVGTTDKTHWLITIDNDKHNYIVIHNLDSMELNPIVLGKLPSKNQDPDFLLQRMLNSSIVVGNYADVKGRIHVFNPDMTGIISNESVQYDLSLDADLELLLTARNTNGVSKAFHVTKTPGGLVLAPERGKKIVLIRK